MAPHEVTIGTTSKRSWNRSIEMVPGAEEPGLHMAAPPHCRAPVLEPLHLRAR
jgi:hypothetical protein